MLAGLLYLLVGNIRGISYPFAEGSGIGYIDAEEAIDGVGSPLIAAVYACHQLCQA